MAFLNWIRSVLFINNHDQNLPSAFWNQPRPFLLTDHRMWPSALSPELFSPWLGLPAVNLLLWDGSIVDQPLLIRGFRRQHLLQPHRQILICQPTWCLYRGIGTPFRQTLGRCEFCQLQVRNHWVVTFTPFRVVHGAKLILKLKIQYNHKIWCIFFIFLFVW